ncbi:MAG: hypothetical protein FIA95_02615 [Gemmatimonadetes bacterium]|nr:hypothetical protein [Gemmatimonadota bacterium]
MMASSFSLDRGRCAALSVNDLREVVHSHTGCDTETSSIVRCILRFGADASIRYYEMLPTPVRRAYRAAPAAAWTVRAVR